ncbi:MAG: BsuBI/PstI family type II restriction endonuclease [Nitrososphaera sp.]|uniref:BsuBI/PstI family type II restriction endonuclease n=1 Tax=Nitrososphaera sp. TaxID=1971748 RepID=UPI003D6E082A
MPGHAYRLTLKSLNEKYAKERQMEKIPVTLPDGRPVTLSSGGQNTLIKKIIEEFAPRFTKDGKVLYLGDTGNKTLVLEEEALGRLGIKIEPRGKIPDVIIHDTKNNWLFLIEAVTSHGPISGKRIEELQEIFKNAKSGLVYVTAFLDRATMGNYLKEISWETEV